MFIDQNVEPVVHSPESSKYDWFRNFDPVSTEVTFWGEDFDIQELVNEMRKLLPSWNLCARPTINGAAYDTGGSG